GVPLTIELATRPPNTAARVAATTAWVSRSALRRKALVSRVSMNTAKAISIEPAMPSWETTAIGQLDARELPKPTPSPRVSIIDCRLLMFQYMRSWPEELCILLVTLVSKRARNGSKNLGYV